MPIAHRLAVTALIALAATAPGCAGRRMRVAAPLPQPPAATGVLRAGAAEVDLTPPPGLPLGGWSRVAGPPAAGARTRLWARALVLEDGGGERLALVAADLWSVSALLQREVASRTARHGIGPDRLMLAATHTHSGPGAFSGVLYYDELAAGQPGFDPDLVEWLADRIAGAVERAASELAPGCVALGATTVEGLSRNRSIEAWRTNQAAGTAPDERLAIDPRLRVLRVNREGESGERQPLAAFALYAVHGTALGPQPGVWHGDLQGIAARELGREGVVAAFLNGASGDISPQLATPGIAETERIGLELGGAARRAFAAVGECRSDLRLARAWREIDLPEAESSAGRLCDAAQPGLAAAAGSEDGRSPVRGWFGAGEGRPRTKPKGCQGHKRPALGAIWRWFFGREAYPQRVAFQAFAIGDLATLVAMPGELTVELGREVERAMSQTRVEVRGEAKARAEPEILLVGLANDYVSYWTTQAEYAAQHYEGGSTLYGPYQGALAVDLAGELGRDLAAGTAPAVDAEREFLTGRVRRFLRQGEPCRGEHWRELGSAWLPGRRPGERDRAWLDWRGSPPDQACDAIPRAMVVCSSESGDTVIASTRSSDFEIRHRGSDRWRATWFVPEGFEVAGPCRLEVARPGGGALVSEPFLPAARRRSALRAAAARG